MKSTLHERIKVNAMIRLAIVEDQKDEAQRLRNFSYSFFDDHALTAEVRLFYNASSFKQAFMQKPFTIIFMDIYLDETSGISASHWIRERDPNVPIIFITSSDEFVWDAFKIHSFDYILKPVKQEDITRALSEVLRLRHLKTHLIDLTVGRQIITVNAYDIQYILSDGHYTNITQKNQTIRAYGNYGQIKQEVEHLPQFVECNRGILVNMNDILQQKDDTFIMSDQRIIPIRRNQRSQIINTFINFQLQKNDKKSTLHDRP